MNRHMLTSVGASAVLAAVLLTAGPSWAQHHGGGGHGGGGHGGGGHMGVGHVGGGGHVGVGHVGAGHVSGGHVGVGHVGGGHVGVGHASGSWHGGTWQGGGARPGYYPYNRFYGYNRGYYRPYGYYPGYAPYLYSPYLYSPYYNSGYDYPSYTNDSYFDYSPDYSNPGPGVSSYQSFYPPADLSPPVVDPRANITVRVPADAQVWFDDNLTALAGPVRQFVSPSLATGKDYYYEVRARWMENGKPVVQTRKVPLHAGERITVDFTTPQ